MALTDNLLAYYACEDDAADTDVADSTANNNDATSTGNTEDMSFAAKVNNGFTFNGSNEKVAMPAIFPGTQTEGSVAMWVECQSDGAEDRPFSYNDENVFAYIRLNDGGSAGAVEMGVKADGADKSVLDTGVSTTDWTFYVLTWKEGGNVTAYINGSSVGTPVAITTVTEISSTGRHIGASRDGGTVYDVNVDEIGIWDKELTSSEVTELWNSGNGQTYPFATNVTVEPAALALSTTATAPTINVLVIPTTQGMSASTHDVEIAKAMPDGTVVVGTGTIGTRFIETDYPYAEGLIAGTTQHLR